VRTTAGHFAIRTPTVSVAAATAATRRQQAAFRVKVAVVAWLFREALRHTAVPVTVYRVPWIVVPDCPCKSSQQLPVKSPTPLVVADFA
jgi:hypothetical protein